MKEVTNHSLIPVQSYIKASHKLRVAIIITSQLMHCKVFADYNISPPMTSGAHLDEGVESLAIHLQELCLNVQHVNLSPGNH